MAQSYLLRGDGKWLERAAWLQSRAPALDAAALRAIWALSGRLDIDRASRLGQRLLERLGPRSRKHRHVMANLAVALPDRDPAERARIARRIWGQLGRVIAEYPHFDAILGAEAAARMTVETRLDMAPYLRGERVGIFASAHTGNWELAAGTARILGYPLSVLYTPFSNPRLDTLVRGRREALGAGLIDRHQGARGMIRALSRGSSIGVLMDQRYDEGEPISFFGHDTPSGVGAAAVALKLGVDFVPVRVERLEDAHFRCTFFEPIRPDPELADPRARARDMTQKLYRIFEDWIRDRPEQWLCVKRRWPREVLKRAAAGA